MGGECYDYDADIDELFLLATKIISPVSIDQDEVYVTVYSEFVLVPVYLLLNGWLSA